MGAIPLEWVDLAAWVGLTGTDIHPEEARILIGLSCIYVTQTAKSKKTDCPAPYVEEETAKIKSDNIKAQMALFKKRRSAK